MLARLRALSFYAMVQLRVIGASILEIERALQQATTCPIAPAEITSYPMSGAKDNTGDYRQS
ncbi:hypothetical protein KJZ61_02805 [Candidatus Dependentiae bacterium]|nr:hypothetical protein [Candidatus Dependentiae bacterium]